jgi:hypothetical protein
MNISRKVQGMVIVSVIAVFVAINCLIFLSLARTAGRADRELKKFHNAFFSGEEEDLGGEFNHNKQVGEQSIEQ